MLGKGEVVARGRTFVSAVLLVVSSTVLSVVTSEVSYAANDKASRQVEAAIAFINGNKPDVVTPCPKYAMATLAGSVQLQSDLDICQSRVLLGATYPNKEFATYFHSWGQNELRYAKASLANLTAPHSYSAAIVNRLYNAYVSKAMWVSQFFARWIARTPYVLAHLNLIRSSNATATGDMYWFNLQKTNVSCQFQTLRNYGVLSTTSNIYCDDIPDNAHVVLDGTGRTMISSGNANGPLGTPNLSSRGVVANGFIHCTFTATSITCRAARGAGFMIRGRSITRLPATKRTKSAVHHRRRPSRRG